MLEIMHPHPSAMPSGPVSSRISSFKTRGWMMGHIDYYYSRKSICDPARSRTFISVAQIRIFDYATYLYSCSIQICSTNKYLRPWLPPYLSPSKLLRPLMAPQPTTTAATIFGVSINEKRYSYPCMTANGHPTTNHYN